MLGAVHRADTSLGEGKWSGVCFYSTFGESQWYYDALGKEWVRAARESEREGGRERDTGWRGRAVERWRDLRGRKGGMIHTLSYPLTHSPTHSHSLTHLLTHPLTHPLTHSPLTYLLSVLTHSPTHPRSHHRSPSLAHSRPTSTTAHPRSVLYGSPPAHTLPSTYSLPTHYLLTTYSLPCLLPTHLQALIRLTWLAG